MQDLMNHIAALNAETRVWIAEDPSNRMAGMLPEDEMYWRDVRGITTVEQFKIKSYEDSYSDMHKDAYGFRPRHDTSTWTLAEWESEIDRVRADLDEELRRKELEKEQAKVDFEKRINDLIETGAGDRETAIRWVVEAECDEFDLMYGELFVCYVMGLPDDMAPIFTSAIADIESRD